MKNTRLKFLASLAKQRLLNKDYDNTINQNKNKASSYFLENARALKRLKAETNYVTIKNEEELEFVEHVKELLKQDCYNPLKKLTDDTYFESLNEFEKEFNLVKNIRKDFSIKNQPKAVIGSFATHDEVSPIITGGMPFANTIAFCQSHPSTP